MCTHTACSPRPRDSGLHVPTGDAFIDSLETQSAIPASEEGGGSREVAGGFVFTEDSPTV
jgi:hypothetical protein